MKRIVQYTLDSNNGRIMVVTRDDKDAIVVAIESTGGKVETSLTSLDINEVRQLIQALNYAANP